ncbi:MAG: hypothetical protein WA774_13535, partial [Candidatus Acidiferrales bacterium]
MNARTSSGKFCAIGESSRLAARIGGISLGVTSVAGGPALVADGELSEFLITDEACDLEFEVGFGGRFESPAGELVFNSGGL